MKNKIIGIIFTIGLLFSALTFSCRETVTEVVRPEKIVSKRQVVYDKDTYTKLAELWLRYNRQFPSEYAYANWMYAARYAGDPDYNELLEKGMKKYPANPTILYLYALQHHGCHDNQEGRMLLEKAASLDPSYNDPWFALVDNYMDINKLEKMDLALRRLLEAGAISEEVMDYNYNMLASMEQNGLLVTNGDNDTYPGWILTRIVKYRPDVSIVNRSLLNTDWYPIFLMETGLPNFITPAKLTELRESILEDIKSKKAGIPSANPFSDTLIVMLIEAAERQNRPVYLAATLSSSEVIDRYREQGRNLGLVTLVTSSDKSYEAQIKQLVDTWLNEYRTGGMDSWVLRYAKQSSAGKMLMLNYSAAIYCLMDEIKKCPAESRLKLFHWYKVHVMNLLSLDIVDMVNHIWCENADIPEIKEWCRIKGYLE